MPGINTSVQQISLCHLFCNNRINIIDVLIGGKKQTLKPTCKTVSEKAFTNSNFGPRFKEQNSLTCKSTQSFGKC